MKYRIGELVLDEQSRTLLKGEQQLKIRPKTLALLLYLAQRAGQIISKEELLANVWDDVKVDEGVIFQSVRDVRQLFDNANIIRNHPRKGYEFTETLKEYSPSDIELKNSKKLIGLLVPAVGALVVLLFVVFEVIWPGQEKPQQPDHRVSQHENRVLIMPVKNRVAYGDYDWLYLGAMEQLIKKLGGLPDSSFVYPAEQVIYLLHALGLNRGVSYHENNSQENNSNENDSLEYDAKDIRKIFDISGATVLVVTELYGNASDYKLVYQIYQENNNLEGAILDPSIPSALLALSEKIAEVIQSPLKTTNSADVENTANQELNDALFAKAMISYESDWETSISFFQSYLTLNPESVIAHIYLSKLYLWQGETDKANEQIAKAAALNPGMTVPTSNWFRGA
jgi:DNA-binding winged helix-turn-helix (wHTH) protein